MIFAVKYFVFQIKNINQMKTLFLFLLCGVLCAASCTEKADDNTIASGTAGTLTWTLSKDGTLTISGKGAMPDYTYSSLYEPYSLPPWSEYKDDIANVIIGNDVSKIGNEAFSGCSKMSSVIIGNSVTIIGYNAFSNCQSLTSVEISNSVTNIASWAFGYCQSLTSVEIPNSVTDIGILAFGFCKKMTSLTIGSSVTTIGGAAFQGCSNLIEIVNYQEIPQFIHIAYYEPLGYTTDPFAGVDRANCTLLVSDGSVEAYHAAEGWKDFVNIKTIQ